MKVKMVSLGPLDELALMGLLAFLVKTVIQDRKESRRELRVNQGYLECQESRVMLGSLAFLGQKETVGSLDSLACLGYPGQREPREKSD
jgi:hypothetical protein